MTPEKIVEYMQENRSLYKPQFETDKTPILIADQFLFKRSENTGTLWGINTLDYTIHISYIILTEPSCPTPHDKSGWYWGIYRAKGGETGLLWAD